MPTTCCSSFILIFILADLLTLFLSFFPPSSFCRTLAPKSSTCELEFYVQYTSPGGTQIIKKITSGSAAQSSQSCCTACQQNSSCRNMSYNVVSKSCTLFKGPSKTSGWNRKAWQYNYISGLVSRRS